MKIKFLILLQALFSLIHANELFAYKVEKKQKKENASETVKPPMGWNSWINYGTSITEAELKETAVWI